MNTISREQLEYHNHSTQLCPYNAGVGLVSFVSCLRYVYAT